MCAYMYIKLYINIYLSIYVTYTCEFEFLWNKYRQICVHTDVIQYNTLQLELLI